MPIIVRAPLLIPVLMMTALILTLGSQAMADETETDIRGLFAEAAAADDRFALGVAYGIGEAPPTILNAGPLHIGTTDQVGIDAPWHIGSITKSFTATLILQLMERGDLELDTPIKSYLTRFADAMHADWQALTLRQLLSHTAGLPANAPIAVLRQPETANPTARRITVLQAIWDKPLRKETGIFDYSNIGYVLAGTIAEEVTGQAWEGLITTNIAEPLGLKSLGFGAPTAASAPWGHSSFLGFKRPVDPNGKGSADNPRWMGPAGRFHMNLKDLIAWGRAHLEACKGNKPALLSQASCQQMQTEIASEYGLAWVIKPQSDTRPRLVWHNGSNTMWYAVLVMIPEHDIVLAITKNRADTTGVDELVKQVIPVLIKAATPAD